MKKPARRWTAAQKLAILRESERDGIAQTCRRHQLAQSMIGKWRQKLEQHGEAGLESYKQRESSETRQLEDENRRLKAIVADKELELQMLRELLKKRDVLFNNNGR